MYYKFQLELFLTQLLLLFAVLVGLYEEPEKPNNALEYPWQCTWTVLFHFKDTVEVLYCMCAWQTFRQCCHSHKSNSWISGTEICYV